MKKVVAFCPADANNEQFYQQLLKSLRKFHSEEELPLIRYDLTDNSDPLKFYRATPLIARELLKEYEIVWKLDADQIITGSLNEILKDDSDYDTGVVLNDPNFPMMVTPYFNNGLVVMKNPDFVEHWWKLCNSPYFNIFQFKEQECLNILINQNYKVKCYDDINIYGEVAKPYWVETYIKDNQIFFKVGDQEKQLRVIHFGGGNVPDKGNYRIKFPPEVVKYIESLIK